MTAKYIIVPGEVRAKDGDVHFITAEQLISLYKLNPADCIVFTTKLRQQGYTEDFLNACIWLGPREDGNYINT